MNPLLFSSWSFGLSEMREPADLGRLLFYVFFIAITKTQEGVVVGQQKTTCPPPRKSYSQEFCPVPFNNNFSSTFLRNPIAYHSLGGGVMDGGWDGWDAEPNSQQCPIRPSLSPIYYGTSADEHCRICTFDAQRFCHCHWNWIVCRSASAQSSRIAFPVIQARST